MRLPILLCLACALAALGCNKRSSDTRVVESVEAKPSIVAFEDISQAAGVTATYENGEQYQAYSILESLGGGVGVADFDLDGRYDLWFPGGGSLNPSEKQIRGLPATLYRQNSDGLKFANASASARADGVHVYTHGCSIADYDNDGFCDVLVTGYGGLQFFRNLGDGTFDECAQSIGLTDTSWSSSAAFGDLNRDGTLDIYVTHYVNWSWENDPKCHSATAEKLADVCTPGRFEGLNDLVYQGDGEGGFQPVDVGLVAGGKGLGVMVADLDGQSGVDIYVANDTTENFLYKNQGDGRFEELGLVSGAALDHRGTPNGSMGLAVLDFDFDRQPDLWVTNFENETFCMYRNQGEANFQCVTERTGITAIGSVYVGFGTTAFDVELDGDEDIVVSNGHVQQHPGSATIAQPPLLLLSDGKGRLTRDPLATDSYFGGRHRGRSVVSVDLNQDGLNDLVFSHVREPAAVLLNRSAAQGKWLAIRLVGREDNRDAIGARVELAVGEKQLFRTVVGGGGYLSQAPYALHWGVPESLVEATIKITWPNGQIQEVSSLKLNELHVVVQP